MNDLEQPMLSYYMIYSEKFKKVMQLTEKEVLNSSLTGPNRSVLFDTQLNTLGFTNTEKVES